MSLVSLKTELRQLLKLTPQLMQSMELLQMNSQELLEYLNRVSEENPMLEQEDTSSLRSAYEELRRKASWIDGGVYGATFSHSESELPQQAATDRETEGLTAFLCDQLDRLHLPKPLLALAKYMAELVDEEGYLMQEDLDSLAALDIPEDLIDEALETLQSLEPAGVGGRDLSECLLLQLSRQKDVPAYQMAIVARFLPELGRGHYGPISRELGVTVQQIQAAEQRIAALEPYPGRSFQPTEPTLYVRPDLFVAAPEGELQVILNEYYLPRVSVSSYYSRLLSTTGDKETRDYLRQKLQQAKWILTSLERRGITLQRCGDAILEAQRPFFAGETTELAPMTLSSLAEQLELHPSTVSRATHGKYLQCRSGTYPLRFFFNPTVGSFGPSRQAVKQRLLTLIKNEDPARPLSDQRLCDLLAADGIETARRTVAKYRMELGFPSSTARKKQHST